MRIVAGSARGRRIAAPPRGVRPTSDKVREAIFDILSSVDGLHVLDLYAGSGALGFEALSRAAASATFVDDSAACAHAIAETAREMGFADRARVLRMPVARAIRSLAREPVRFDLVLVDPPYGKGLAWTTFADLIASPILAPGATLVLETATRDARPELVTPVSSRRYGDTTVHFLTVQPTSPTEIDHGQDRDLPR